ncbi:MAG TPA: chorismate-binding protein [Thermoanaerobaculia bacterium]
MALRSCVLRGREAYLYAGAGIMRDSDPELERRETELKKQALLRALGA